MRAAALWDRHRLCLRHRASLALPEARFPDVGWETKAEVWVDPWMQGQSWRHLRPQEAREEEKE